MMGYCELISGCAQDISRDVLVSESQGVTLPPFIFVEKVLSYINRFFRDS